MSLSTYLKNIADAIRSKKGTATPINAQDFASEILTIETGIDTTDATATNGDILLGKTAYVNDEKIEGTIETYDYSTDEGGSSGDLIEQLNNNTLTSYSNNWQRIKAYLFYYNTNLEIIDFPNVEFIDAGAFSYCENLKTINLPKLKSTSIKIFSYTGLTEIDFPLITQVSYSAFQDMQNLLIAKLENATELGNACFSGCRKLHTVYVNKMTKTVGMVFRYCYSLKKVLIEQTDSICTLNHTNDFQECCHILGTTNATFNPNGDKDGYIYVPATLLSQYKVATNWATYETQIIGHQDFNVGDTLPSYANDTYTTCTWYSDETLTTVATSVTTSGRYYCRLEA